ncbi:hypothetical protein ACH422_36130 [Streptomyces wedmorensis]|uniref:hypothetical protein n=1 Tax=Streptomyces wedmorensis TaxID=43759 RepID=UPI0037B99762
MPRLSEKQFAQLEAELAKGSSAHGWEDQRLTKRTTKAVRTSRPQLLQLVGVGPDSEPFRLSCRCFVGR